jgi:hypothetical protein
LWSYLLVTLASLPGLLGDRAVTGGGDLDFG